MKIRDRSTLDLFRGGSPSPITAWIDPNEPIGDNFAGGGGARLGISMAAESLNLTPGQGVAVNHWPAALAMYQANHPECRVFCEDIVKVKPAEVSGGRRFSFAWFSPTCIYFSQAKGGPLDEEATKVRGLAWLAVSWAASPARPRVLCLENVPPFMQWGPLHRVHSNGCSKQAALANGKQLRNGKFKPKCLKGCCYLRPIKARRGSLFQAFVRKLGKYYRHVEWRVLTACDFGAPTSRKRFVLIASDEPASWPEPTHGPGRAQPHRTAAECIDWSIPCPSIFERATPLVDTTLARIRAGMERFVFGAARPFIVPVSYGSKGGPDDRADGLDEPIATICGNRGGHALISPLVVRAAHGDVDSSGKRRGQGAHAIEQPLGTICASGTEFAIATPVLVHRSNGERPGQAPRAYDVAKPLGTIVAEGQKHGLALPILVKNYSEREGGFAGGQPIYKPASTITQKDHHALAAMHLTKLRGTSDAHVDASGRDPREPLPTISGGGEHHGAVAAYLIRYNGNGGPESLGRPLSTIDTRDRFALVTMTLEREVCAKALRVAKFLGYDAPIVLEIDGEQWVLVDIGFRMLTARELFLCQGFPPGYVIDVDFGGKPLSKTAQIKCVGNSVPPQLAEAVARAAFATIRYEPEHHQRKAA